MKPVLVASNVLYLVHRSYSIPCTRTLRVCWQSACSKYASTVNCQVQRLLTPMKWVLILRNRQKCNLTPKMESPRTGELDLWVWVFLFWVGVDFFHDRPFAVSRASDGYKVGEQEQWCRSTLGYVKAFSREYATEVGFPFDLRPLGFIHADNS